MLLLLAGFLGETNLGRVELFLGRGEQISIHVRRVRLIPLLNGALPVGGGQLQAPRFLVKIAEMILHRGIRTHAQRRLGKIFFREIVLAQLEISPAKRIEVGAVGGIEADGGFDVIERFVEFHAAIDIHVTEIVQRNGALRIEDENLFEFRLGLLVLLFALEGGTTQEVNVFLVFGLERELLGLVERLFGIAPALEARVHDRQAEVDVAILVVAFEQRADIGQRLFGIAGIIKLHVQHHAQIAIIGHLLRGFPGDGGSLRPILGIAISVDDVLIAGAGVVVAQRNHLAEGLGGVGVIFLIAIDHSEALEKDSAIIAIGLRVGAVRLFGFLNQVLQNLDGLVVAGLSLVNDRHVVRHFESVGNHRLGFFQALEGILILALAAINFRDAKVGLRVFGIGIGDDAILVESGIDLAIIQKIFREPADGVEIVAIELDGVLVSVDGAFVFLALFVGSAERGIQLGRAAAVRNRAKHLQRLGGIAFIGVKQRKRGDGFFGIRIELHRGLQFAFRFLQVVVEAIEAAEQEVIVHVLGLDFDDLLVLLDGQLQDIFRPVSAAGHVSEQTQVNAAEQFVGFEIVGITLENFLRLQHGVADAAGFDVKLGQAGGQEFRRRVGFDGKAIFLHRLVGQLAAAVHRDLLFVHVSERVVVIRGGAICLAGILLRSFSLVGRGTRRRCRTGLRRGNSRENRKREEDAENSVHARPGVAGINRTEPIIVDVPFDLPYFPKP